MTPADLALVAGAVLLGNLVKGVTGFGSALVAIPLCSFVLPPAEAMAAVVTADAVAGSSLLWTARKEVPWPLVAAGLTTLLPGQWLGTALQASLPMELVRRVLGGVVLAMAGMMLAELRRPTTRDRVPTALGAAFVCAGAGVMGGLVGTPGPLMVRWSQRTLNRAAARAWLIAVFFPGALSFVSSLVVNDLVPPSLLVSALAAVPAALAGALAGGALAPRVDRARFTWLAAGALGLSGAALLWGAGS